MTFLTPWMLFGVLAAGIPVAIHLFFRSRYRTVPWAAMKFLLTSVEQTSRRLKFQELLLLALRMIVLAMLALAFARPISSVVRGSARGDSVDAVFVIDTSFSMGARDGAKTRLQRAQDEALKIIDELPPHSTVQIVTCSGKTKTIVGPRSPANLDQARQLIENLDIDHLATDLAPGVSEAQGLLTRGQASNKELYVFSDMQKLGFEDQSGDLKATLNKIKENTIVHMVRCGNRELRNAAIVGIKQQTDVPRPGERLSFAVLVKNTGRETVNDVKVTLAVDGDEKKLESAEIKSLAGGDIRAVTLSPLFDKPGPRVVTVRLGGDDLEADNRFDHVLLVREQLNILVVDGNFNEKDPEKASSFYLMHSLLPVKEALRALYKYNPHVVPAHLASPMQLTNQDICILVNCAMPGKVGNARALHADFIDALNPFVRKGKGLIVFSGDNVQPEPYNKLLGKKYGLLPMPLKATIKAPGKTPFFINRDSFGDGPPAYWKFKDDKYYEIFDAVPVWQHFDLDESGAAKKPAKNADEPANESPEHKDDNPVQVIMKLNTDKPLAVSRRVDAGEVIFIGTAAQQEGLDPKTGIPNWTMFNKLPPYLYFLDVTLAHLMNRQTQTYNLVAGQTLHWQLTDKQNDVYNLVHPDGKTIDRLGIPEKIGNRYMLTATNLPRAGVYRMTLQPRGSESSGESIDVAEAIKTGTPIAVIPDPAEIEDLTSLTAGEIDTKLGFTPIHIVAGEESPSTGAERLNREWTVWALLAVLALVLLEVVLAWWCGRAW